MSSTNDINLIFIGTSDFGIPSFEAIQNSKDINIQAVITQPDKPVGRKQILTPPPIKKVAQSHDLPVLQPEKISSITEQITSFAPDLLVVIAYAQIIPVEILNIPRFGAINVHGSLLPKYRGASCIQHPIANGDKSTGVTIMQMDKGLDTGPILRQKEVEILDSDTGGSLFEKLSALGAELIIPTINDLVQNKIEPQPQDNAQASYVGLLSRKDGQIDWSKSALEIERFIRAMDPWPGTFTFLNKKRLKILKSSIIPINKYKIGEIFPYNGSLGVQCGNDALMIEKLQLEGKNALSGADFIRGHANVIGNII